MTVAFTSTQTEPRARGAEFGETFRAEVAASIDGYRELFAARGSRDLAGDGAAALAAIENFAPMLADELHGLAAGAGQPVHHLAAVNARTEILAAVGASTRGECATVVALGEQVAAPIAMQNWDWFAGLADTWLIWTIPHPDGRVPTTVTEFGMLGKFGINNAGVGLLFNILHHRSDGRAPIGVPVHIVARRVLDTATDANTALLTIAGARASASTALTVVTGGRAGKTAITAEMWPGGPGFVLPSPDGLLLHTNHFLDPIAHPGDTEPVEAPDTLIRYEVLQRTLHPQRDKLTPAAVRAALSDHTGGAGAVCCHPATDAADDYLTLATVELDLDTGSLHATAGPACSAH